MNLSRKIILSSCACAAFLAGVYSCTVDERNIEDKDVFVCLLDEDCLSPDSVCAGGDGVSVTGRCRAKNQLDPCADYDGDGYMGVDQKWLEINANQGGSAQCGNPVDIDDTDPDVHPGATEYCDGKDNNGDGCVDGKCMCEDNGGNCNCDGRTELCAALTENCIGRKNINKMSSNAVCSPEVAGVMFCKTITESKKGVWVYGKASGRTGNGGKFYRISDFNEVSGGQCPTPGTSGNEKVQVYTIEGRDYNYVENEVTLIKSSTELASMLCSEEDHDCNGKSGEEEGGTNCRSCQDTLTQYYNSEDKRNCRVYFNNNNITSIFEYKLSEGSATPSLSLNNNYSKAISTYFSGTSAKVACSATANTSEKCACIGKVDCNGKILGCLNNGYEINEENLKNAEIFKIKDPSFKTNGWCEITE